jgi:hypothetical protein
LHRGSRPWPTPPRSSKSQLLFRSTHPTSLRAACRKG